MIDMNDPEVIESLKYLLVPKAEKIRLAAMPYSSVKNFFVPCKDEGYECAEITKEEGDNITLMTRKNKSVTFKRDQLLQMNPPKYEMCDDMADLTYLNDATVYHNLRERYVNWYIYTYSGLFCVTINPFKRLPLYTMKMVHYYRGKKKNEVPPHLYLVADSAYAAMCRDKKNQSMLITGESGAGKTENTKKVIQYFAFVAANVGKKSAVDPNKPSLEDQIVSANPVLEAYGNAKTTRNNNSSRFGKFIRIHFTNIYAIAGADIESYLLEKSRITYCMELERNYHIFYQLCSGAFPELNKEIMLEADASKYFYVNQGMLKIDKVDDVQEMKDTKQAFDTLCFTQEQQLDLFKLTSGVANWGNQQWKQRPREEQAEPDGTESLEIVAKVMGLDCEELIKGITKPRIKVGNDFVNKGQNKDQCTNSVSALSKAAFARAFSWLVDVANLTLDVKELKRAHFIGVLDIAGFETFEYNGFEQICINFTNERLQQFFNNFMFVLEQAEYTKEGIEWKTESFGADLQATIDLIEKKMGIFAILEEECIVPKATDMTFKEKLYKQHLGKHPSFAKPKPKKGARFEAHFDLTHYAGVVSYSVDGWLDKNKDPINMTVATLFKESKGNALLAFLFRDIGAEDAAGKKKGGGSANTISSGHREQLNKLMNTLDATSPHFVRCIIPNEIKTGGVLDAHLVMHQLNCNGVLEGIRICRKGYPSRLIFSEFIARYGILAASRVKAKGSDLKAASFEVLDEIKMDTENYRIGLTKVLFKAGILGSLEELRDVVIEKLLRLLQSQMRRYVVKKNIGNMLSQKKALTVLQKNLQSWLQLRTWKWQDLMNNIRPLLQGAKKEEERLAREAEEARLAEEARQEAERLANLEAEAAAAAAAQAEAERIEREKKAAAELVELQTRAENNELMVKKLSAQKFELENQVMDLDSKLASADSKCGDLLKTKRKLEEDLNDCNNQISELNFKLCKSDSTNKEKEDFLRKLQDDMANLDESGARLAKEKKRLEEANLALQNQLLQEQDKTSQLSRSKTGLEKNLDELEMNLDRERKLRADLDKAKRKVESDLKSAGASLEEACVLRAGLEETVKRKDAEISGLNSKLEDEKSRVNGTLKKVKEVERMLLEAEEEIAAQRDARYRAEKQRGELSRELDELSIRLDEAGGATAAQVEINRKREYELVKLRQDLEAANVQNEQVVQQLKTKHQEAVAEMSTQIEKVCGGKNLLEKEKQALRNEVSEAKTQIDDLYKSKTNIDKAKQQLELQVQELNDKLDESGRHLSDVCSQRNRLQVENSSVLSQLEEAESLARSFASTRQQLSSQIDEARRQAEDEGRVKASLAQQLRNLNADFASLKSELEDENAKRNELQKLLSKASVEAQQWRQKYETEGVARAEEFEESKRKLSGKLQEAEEQLEQAVAKCVSVEKSKQRLQAEVDDLMVDVERANTNAAGMEKKQKQFDRLVGEWRAKCESVTCELEASQKEARLLSAEVFKVKSQYQEAQQSIETIRNENKCLAEEIRDMYDQLTSGGKTIHDLEKSKKYLEVQKEDLQAALEAAESALEQAEAKVVVGQLELASSRQEIELRLMEKEEEFNNTRANHQRAIESMQASLNAEIKTRSEVVRQKRKLEGDVNELEISLEHSRRNLNDAHANIKKLGHQIEALQGQLEDEQHQRCEAKDQQAAAERHSQNLVGELNDMHSSVEQAERARKLVEHELHEAAERMSELSSVNSTLVAQKRKVECDIASVQADLDEAVSQLKAADDKVRKLNAESQRLSDELASEQDHSANSEKARKTLETQLKEFQGRLDQAEANALRGSKRAVDSLENRIHEIESELLNEQKRHQETVKELTKSDRRLKEFAFQSEEDKKSMQRMVKQIEKLEGKMKVLRRQVDETEEIASVNLHKFRSAQQDLEAAFERAEIAENQVNKIRAVKRSSSIAPTSAAPQSDRTRGMSMTNN